MSVSSTVILAVFALLALLPVTQQASARTLILHASQLEKDKRISKQRRMYESLSAANVLYQQCGTELNITEEQQAYLKKKFAEVTLNYQYAFQQVYTDRVLAPPSSIFLNDVAMLMQKTQQDAVDNTANQIEHRGCKQRQLKPVVDYVEALRQQDATPAQPITPADVAPAALQQN